MFENVLIGVDGRQSGRDAIELARRLAGPGASLSLVHVRVERRADHSVALLKREARAAGIDASLVSVRQHSPGRGLHQQVEQQRADLLVVGSCSRSPLGRAALGDDTRAAVNGIPCAVAIAPKGFASRSHRIAKIGVGYDGSAESANALKTARELAVANRATIHVLQVVLLPLLAYTNYVGPEVRDTINDLLATARKDLAELQDVETRAEYGSAGEKLAEFGEEVDILVVGSRGYGPLHRFIAGSTCDYLERHARCPLLVMPRTVLTDPGDVVIDRLKPARAPA